MTFLHLLPPLISSLLILLPFKHQYSTLLLSFSSSLSSLILLLLFSKLSLPSLSLSLFFSLYTLLLPLPNQNLQIHKFSLSSLQLLLFLSLSILYFHNYDIVFLLLPLQSISIYLLSILNKQQNSNTHNFLLPSLLTADALIYFSSLPYLYNELSHIILFLSLTTKLALPPLHIWLLRSSQLSLYMSSVSYISIFVTTLFLSFNKFNLSLHLNNLQPFVSLFLLLSSISLATILYYSRNIRNSSLILLSMISLSIINLPFVPHYAIYLSILCFTSFLFSNHLMLFSLAWDVNSLNIKYSFPFAPLSFISSFSNHALLSLLSLSLHAYAIIQHNILASLSSAIVFISISSYTLKFLPSTIIHQPHDNQHVDHTLLAHFREPPRKFLFLSLSLSFLSFLSLFVVSFLIYKNYFLYVFTDLVNVILSLILSSLFVYYNLLHNYLDLLHKLQIILTKSLLQSVRIIKYKYAHYYNTNITNTNHPTNTKLPKLLKLYLPLIPILPLLILLSISLSLYLSMQLWL